MSGCKMQRLSFALALFLLASLFPACAQTTGNSPPIMDALVAREIAVLELAGGGTPLTAAERQAAAQAVPSALEGNRAVLLQNDAALAEPLQRAAGDPAYAAGLRRALRYAAEENKPVPPGLEEITAIERKIVRAHDPTVIFDPARQHLITEVSLRDFRAASGWLAQQWNLPPPSANFTAHVRDWFRADYLKTDNNVAQVLARQGESFPYVAPALAQADPKRKEAAIQQVRQQLQAADPASRDLTLAASVAVLGALAERQTASAGHPWDNNPLLSEESKEILDFFLPGGAAAAATVQGINNADIFAHDIYRQ